VGCAADRRRAGVQPYDSSPVFGGGRLGCVSAVAGRPRNTWPGLRIGWRSASRRHGRQTPMWFRQELEREEGGSGLSLRNGRAGGAVHLRRRTGGRGAAAATIRFETGRPGKQLQIDFGERRAMIGDENVQGVSVLSRRWATRGGSISGRFANERQESWFGRCGGVAFPSLWRSYRRGAARQ